MKAIRSFVTEQILLVKNSVNDTVRENCPSAELFLARIQSEYRKIRTRSNSVFGHFSRNDKIGNNTQLQEKSNEKYLTEEIRHIREEKKTKNCMIQRLMENENNLLKRIKSADGNNLSIFSTQSAQGNNFITPRHYGEYCDSHKNFTIDTRNQFQPLENVTEEQPNNNELNMAQDTTNNSRNEPTMTAKKSVEKYHKAQTLATIILFHQV